MGSFGTTEKNILTCIRFMVSEVLKLYNSDICLLIFWLSYETFCNYLYEIYYVNWFEEYEESLKYQKRKILIWTSRASDG